jgi:hypothetical protein
MRFLFISFLIWLMTCLPSFPALTAQCPDMIVHIAPVISWVYSIVSWYDCPHCSCHFLSLQHSFLIWLFTLLLSFSVLTAQLPDMIVHIAAPVIFCVDSAISWSDCYCSCHFLCCTAQFPDWWRRQHLRRTRLGCTGIAAYAVHTV